jgi:hypothetical protein
MPDRQPPPDYSKPLPGGQGPNESGNQFEVAAFLRRDPKGSMEEIRAEVKSLKDEVAVLSKRLEEQKSSTVSTSEGAAILAIVMETIVALKMSNPEAGNSLMQRLYEVANDSSRETNDMSRIVCEVIEMLGERGA